MARPADELAMVAHGLHPLDPTALGAWALTTRIATGSGTVVYRAVDRRGRVAAVKAPLPYGEDRTVLARLCREARVLSGVGAVGVAHLIEDGTAADIPHLVLELVDGPSLRTLVDRRGALEGRDAFAIAAATARALVRIHAWGIVHADLKPANVLCGPGGPVIVDFDAATRSTATTGPGLVLLGGGGADLDDATVEDTFRASPSWLAPEQALGEPVTGASDVFSWAALATFGLTGHPPFGVAPAPVLLYRVVHEAPDLGDLPRPLAVLLGAALEKDPANRPTAVEVVGGLRRLAEVARRRRDEARPVAA
jgi:serine/threonine protein kinase